MTHQMSESVVTCALFDSKPTILTTTMNAQHVVVRHKHFKGIVVSLL